MNSPCNPMLQGDGIKFSFFHYLWMKNRGQLKEFGTKKFQSIQKGNWKVKSTQIRLPDTVIFRLGQPLQWYFTSERGGQPSLLRKRKQNLNVEKIENVFIKKARNVNKDWLDSNNDILAYFISSSNASGHTAHLGSKLATSDKYGHQHHDHNNILDSLIADADDDPTNSDTASEDDYYSRSCCNIEYFNEEGLSKYI
jgi:hypothetical protein